MLAAPLLCAGRGVIAERAGRPTAAAGSSDRDDAAGEGIARAGLRTAPQPDTTGTLAGTRRSVHRSSTARTDRRPSSTSHPGVSMKSGAALRASRAGGRLRGAGRCADDTRPPPENRDDRRRVAPRRL